MGVMTDYTKAMKLMSVLRGQLESTLNPEQYLIDICHVLINQQHRTLTDIATSILHQLGKYMCVYIISDQYSHYNIINTLGQSIPDNVSSHTVLPSPVDDISNTPVANIRGNKLFNVYTLFLSIYD